MRTMGRSSEITRYDHFRYVTRDGEARNVPANCILCTKDTLALDPVCDDCYAKLTGSEFPLTIADIGLIHLARTASSRPGTSIPSVAVAEGRHAETALRSVKRDDEPR